MFFSLSQIKLMVLVIISSVCDRMLGKAKAVCCKLQPITTGTF